VVQLYNEILFGNKRNQLSGHKKTQKNLKYIFLSERNCSEKMAYYIIPTIWYLGKDKTIVKGSYWGVREGWIGGAREYLGQCYELNVNCLPKRFTCSGLVCSWLHYLELIVSWGHYLELTHWWVHTEWTIRSWGQVGGSRSLGVPWRGELVPGPLLALCFPATLSWATLVFCMLTTVMFCLTTVQEQQSQGTMDWNLWNHEPKVKGFFSGIL
jgi:hypothetical protein